LPADPRKTVSRAAILVLLGICAGAGSLVYLRRRRATASRLSGSADSTTPVAAPIPKPGDILLFHNARGLNKLITGFTGSPFYHAGLYAGDGRTVEARTAGVVRQDLRGRENDFVVVPAPEGKGIGALAWAETQVGDAYDDLDIAVIILDRICRFIHFNYAPRNKFSCGEFVAVAFDRAGAHLFPKRDLSDVVPGDFARFAPFIERQNVR
jgi:uncharacterized protein YycO